MRGEDVRSARLWQRRGGENEGRVRNDLARRLAVRQPDSDQHGADHGPSDPSQIPGSLLLKLNVPGANSTIRKKKIEVSGVAEPGAHIEIQGRTIRTDAKGAYKTTVQLAEGANSVKARVLTVGGASAEKSESVTVDSRVESMKVVVPWKKK